MVAFNSDIMDQVYPGTNSPFARTGAVASPRIADFFEPAFHARESATIEEDRSLFDANLRKARENLRGYRNGIARLIELHHSNQEDISIADVSEQPDVELLRRARECGFFAERTLDEIEDLSEQLQYFERFKEDQSLWSRDAGAFLIEFRDTLAVLIWTEKTARHWVLQLLAEYERRHPEINQTNLESVDLGPSNAARLPPML